MPSKISLDSIYVHLISLVFTLRDRRQMASFLKTFSKKDKNTAE